MFRTKLVIVLILIGLFSLCSHAALVVLDSVKADDTRFEVRATVSGGDSGGIALYSVQLEDRPDIVKDLTLQNYAPRIRFVVEGETLTAGFDLFRSPLPVVNKSSGTITCMGAQDTISGGAILVYNFGLAEGNLEDLNAGGWIAYAGVQAAYSKEVILARGSTGPGAPAPRLLNNGNVMVPGQIYTVGDGTFFNVFISPSGGGTMSAAVAVATPTPPPDPNATPTPTPTPDPYATPTPIPTATPTPPIDGEPTPVPTPFNFPTPIPEATPTPGDEVTPTPEVDPILDPGRCLGLGMVIPLALVGAVVSLGGIRFRR